MRAGSLTVRVDADNLNAELRVQCLVPLSPELSPAPGQSESLSESAFHSAVCVSAPLLTAAALQALGAFEAALQQALTAEAVREFQLSSAVRSRAENKYAGQGS